MEIWRPAFLSICFHLRCGALFLNPVEACAERRSELLERLKKTEEFERVITTLGQTSL